MRQLVVFSLLASSLFVSIARADQESTNNNWTERHCQVVTGCDRCDDLAPTWPVCRYIESETYCCDSDKGAPNDLLKITP